MEYVKIKDYNNLSNKSVYSEFGRRGVVIVPTYGGVGKDTIDPNAVSKGVGYLTLNRAYRCNRGSRSS